MQKDHLQTLFDGKINNNQLFDQHYVLITGRIFINVLVNHYWSSLHQPNSEAGARFFSISRALSLIFRTIQISRVRPKIFQ